MKLLVGTEMTPERLLDTDLVSPEATWLPGTTYGLGAIVKLDQSVYESIQASNTGHNPATALTWWVRIGSTNDYAMFDGQISSLSSATESFYATIDTGTLDTFAIIGASGYSATLVVRDGEGGPIVYEQTAGLGAEVFDWFEYFFHDPLINRTVAIFTDIPPFLNSVATITIETGAAATASIGVCLFGRLRELGKSQYGASGGIRDFSRKEVDETFGNPVFVRRGYAKKLDVDVLVSNSEVNRVVRSLTDIRAVPSLWIGSDRQDLEEVMVVYGFYRDWRMLVEYFSDSMLNLEIEGLI